MTAKQYYANIINAALQNGWTKEDIANNPHKAAEMYLNMQMKGHDEAEKRLVEMHRNGSL